MTTEQTITPNSENTAPKVPKEKQNGIYACQKTAFHNVGADDTFHAGAGLLQHC